MCGLRAVLTVSVPENALARLLQASQTRITPVLLVVPTASSHAARLRMIFSLVPPLRLPAVRASEHASEGLQRQLATTRSTRTAAAGLLQAQSSSFWLPERCRRTGTRASTRMPVCFCVCAREWACRLISCNRGAPLVSVCLYARFGCGKAAGGGCSRVRVVSTEHLSV